MDYGLHGANPERFIDGDVFDFSTNTNVLPLDYTIDKTLAMTYPSTTIEVLKELLPYDNDNLLFTSGVNEAIYIIASMFDSYDILQPTYVEYERAITGYDKVINHIYNLSEIKSECVFICNPNNPTGEVRELEKTIMKHKDKVFIVDESYKDFIEYKELPLYKNVIYLRSLTKSYHLSGLRLGYVYADMHWINKINDRKPTWSVNSFAIDVAKQMLQNKDFIVRTKKFYKEESKWFKNKVSELGFQINDSSMHYFLIRIDRSVIPFMIKHNIFVRHTDNFKGLNGEYIRVCTRTRKENLYFIEKLEEFKRNL